MGKDNHSPTSIRVHITADTRRKHHPPGVLWDVGVHAWHAKYGKEDLGFYREKEDAIKARQEHLSSLKHKRKRGV